MAAAVISALLFSAVHAASRLQQTIPRETTSLESAEAPDISPPRARDEVGLPSGRVAEYALFNFVRAEYDSVGGWGEAYYEYDGRFWERWQTDHPQGDENFAFRLSELTTVRPNQTSVTLRLTDERLFDFPFLYFCDVGWMTLDDVEVNRLRDYLLRGGFLWVDDFWGYAEWRNLELIMERVLPESPWRTLKNDHAIFRQLFPLPGLPQIPARDFAWGGNTADPEYIHRQPAYGVENESLRGWYDPDGRLVAVASLNSDVGDGWEREAYGEDFFERFSSVAYAMGANIVIYSLIH